MTDPPSGARRGAFFDVDYTILSDNSATLFVKHLRRQGKVGLWTMVQMLYYLLRYKLNLLDFERLAERELKKYAGHPEAEMIALCDRWFEDEVTDYIYPEARELIEKHRQAGDLVTLLSASSIYLVRPLARHLGLEHYLCNRPELDGEGRFTGRLVRPVCYGPGKIRLAEEFCREHGLELSDSFYYSDSITDLAALERFGRPVAVNPDPLLKKEAIKRGWQIIEFRKTRPQSGG